MVEGNVTFDLLPNVDLKAFTAWAQKAWAATAKAPGFIEGRAQRGIIAAAQGRSVGVWKSMADWTNFMETTWLPLKQSCATLRQTFRIHAGDRLRFPPSRSPRASSLSGICERCRLSS